jgi:hypothetical protein
MRKATHYQSAFARCKYTWVEIWKSRTEIGRADLRLKCMAEIWTSASTLIYGGRRKLSR